jgi:hypothetical protein
MGMAVMCSYSAAAIYSLQAEQVIPYFIFEQFFTLNIFTVKENTEI